MPLPFISKKDWPLQMEKSEETGGFLVGSLLFLVTVHRCCPELAIMAWCDKAATLL